ncbi:hypothetical protein ACFSTC_12000 [Nonomuraea ferruginea]
MAPFPARVITLCLAESRPSVLAVSSLRYLTGVALALPITSLADPLMVFQGGVAWVASIFAIYLYNGVTDIAEDRINGSGSSRSPGASCAPAPPRPWRRWPPCCRSSPRWACPAR